MPIPTEDQARFESALAAIGEEGGFGDAVVANSLAQRDALWALRDDVGQVFAHGEPFVFDVSLPVAEMEGYVAEVHAALAARLRRRALLHLRPSRRRQPAPGRRRPGRRGCARGRSRTIVYTPLAARAGSISAEHGIGIEKRSWLPLSRSPTEIALMQRLKQALDPRGILNPGRVVGN